MKTEEETRRTGMYPVLDIDMMKKSSNERIPKIPIDQWHILYSNMTTALIHKEDALDILGTTVPEKCQTLFYSIKSCERETKIAMIMILFPVGILKDNANNNLHSSVSYFCKNCMFNKLSSAVNSLSSPNGLNILFEAESNNIDNIKDVRKMLLERMKMLESSMRFTLNIQGEEIVLEKQKKGD